MFKVGDRVRWESQSGGYWKAKEGKVVEVVPIGKRPNNDITGGIGLLGRIHVSYVVQLNGTGKGTVLKAKFYWPVVSKLTKIE